LDPSILKFFAAYIEKELGIIYADSNYFQLQNRLEEVAKTYNFSGVDELYKKSQKNIPDNLKQHLLDLATNNETSFFRDVKVFNGINFLLSKCIDEKNFNNDFRIWSAACSTGQEPISLSILLHELAKKSHHQFKFKIHGSDISERALKKAMKGQYSTFELSRGLSEEYKTKYFESVGNENWQVSSDIMRPITFKKRNLKEILEFDDLNHFIFCRNVLIYQKVESKIEILNQITKNLISGGYLILGSGESLFGLSNSYEQVMVEGAVFYRKL